MGSKVLVGAVVAVFSVWFGVWKLADRSRDSVALAAPEDSTQAHRQLAGPLDSPGTARNSLVEPEPEVELIAGEPIPEFVPQPLVPHQIAGFVLDLCDDEIPFNATHALGVLTSASSEVIPALQAALSSNDWQQRQLAAVLLAHRTDTPADARLAEVLVDALRPDEPPYPRVCVPQGTVSNCEQTDSCEAAVERLRCDNALFALAEHRLELRLNSDDPRSRAQAAFLLAVHRSECARERVLATLIGALEDDGVPGDARLGLRGLVRLGSAAREALEKAWPGRDWQQRALVSHLLTRYSPQHRGAHALRPVEFTHMGLPVGDPLLIREYGIEP